MFDLFKSLLADKVNNYAAACSHHAREQEEFPPNELYYFLRLHRDLYDAITQKSFEDFLVFYDTIYLEKYGYNVVWSLKDILPDELKTEKFYKIANTKQQIYINDFPVELNDKLFFFIKNNDGNEPDGSLCVVVNKFLIDGNVFHDGKLVINDEFLDWDFNYCNPVKVENFDFIFNNSEPASEKTLLEDNDVIIYKIYDEIYQMVVHASDYLFDEEKDMPVLGDLTSWQGRDFYNRYAKALNVEEVFVSKTLNCPVLENMV